MPTRIECRVEGTNALAAATRLGELVRERGGAMLMENPATVAAGDGWIAIDLPEVRGDAAAILNAMLNQIPGACDLIRPVPRGEGLDAS